LSMDFPAPDHSTFSRFRSRLLGTDVPFFRAHQIEVNILLLCHFSTRSQLPSGVYRNH
jgi:hypothetical protein